MSGPQRIYRLKDVERFTGYKHSQIDELVKQGKLPKPIPLADGGRAKGWLESELLAWQADRIAKRDAA